MRQSISAKQRFCTIVVLLTAASTLPAVHSAQAGPQFLRIENGQLVQDSPITLPEEQPTILARVDMARSQQQEILEAHNRYRKEVGVPNLVWSKDLAKSAQTWANHLASLGGETLVHDSRSKTGQGENLAMGTANDYSLSDLVAGWGDEKQYFKAGKFPNVSNTRNWQDVGHYTQVVWRDTKQVGCAKATAGGNDILVCRYLAPGNRVGQKVF